VFYIIAVGLLCLHLSHASARCSSRSAGKSVRMENAWIVALDGDRWRFGLGIFPYPLPLFSSHHMKLDARIPDGPLTQKWDRRRFEMKLVNPANKRKFDIIVVGTVCGGGGGGELRGIGYNVKAFCYRTVRAGRTASRPRANQRGEKLPKRRATAFIGCFTTRLKAVIFGRVKRMCIGWRR